jgi:hypothetical protein
MADRLEAVVLLKVNSVEEEDKLVDRHLLDLIRPNCCYEMDKTDKKS